MESKAYVRLKYGKRTVKYGKSRVLCGNFYLAPTVIYYSRHSGLEDPKMEARAIELYILSL